jgi:hypothetical protein
MAYLVNKTDGTLLVRVLDGQTNNTTSSLVFIGKQVTNYGELQNENFLRLLENFSNTTDPVNPVAGQIWWDTVTQSMRVFNGSVWRPVTGFTSAQLPPAVPREGDRWWDSVNQQLRIWTGTEWVVVGPSFSVLSGKAGALVETVPDIYSVQHSVTKLYNNGSVTAILSSDAEFTPAIPIDGFSSIPPGMILRDLTKFTGTATNSDQLGSLLPVQFLRSDVPSVTTANLTVRPTLTVGNAGELAFSANGTSTIASTGNLRIVSGTHVSLGVNGGTGLVSVTGNPTENLHIAPKQFVDQSINQLKNGLLEKIGAIVEVILDVNGASHTISKLYNNTVVTAIVSADDSFVPLIPISGFTTVTPGITLNNNGILGGTALNSQRLGNLEPTRFLRTDVPSTSTSDLAIRGSLSIGPGNQLLVNSAGITSTGNLIVSAGAYTAFSINSISGLVSVAGLPSQALHIAPKQYVDSTVEQLRTTTTGYINSSTLVINGTIESVQAQVTQARNDIAALAVNKASVSSPVLTGIPSAPTAGVGTSTSQLATTAFVTGATSVFDTGRIFNGSSYVRVDTSSISLAASGILAATVTTTGIVTITQPAKSNSTLAATTAYVDRGDKNFILSGTNYQPTNYVSPLAPNNSIGVDGDFWFQYI